ncbi:MAG TPA: hypothetical protein VFM58_03890 [Solirubrobacteraceae bacterium]|nr:hypothetical protein [Solirubrobacteraceae bacterium]
MHAFRRIVSLIAAVLVLGVPGGALAQTPGDDQYTDPFGGDNQEQPSSPSQAEPEPTVTPEPTPEVAAPPAEPTQTTQTTPTPAATTAQTGEQLPRTGGDPLPVAVAGFWLLLGGVALRARVRPR